MGEGEHTDDSIDVLVDEYRDECLWFLRRDYYPKTLEQKLRVLAYIARHGDQEAYRKAAEARQWLLQSSNETSAAVAELPTALERGAILFHEGRIRGAFPQLVHDDSNP